MITEEKAWQDLMLAINNMGAIPQEKFNYKNYHRSWDVLIDRARMYRDVAKLNEKYGLDNEVQK